MKKFFFAIATIAVAAVACNKETEAPKPEGIAKKHITVIAEPATTKTVFDENREALKWAEGDNFRLMSNTLSADANHDAQTLTYVAGGKFDVEVSEDADKVYAYYFAGDFTDANHSTPTAYTAYIDPVQTQSKAGVLNGQNLPMAAKGTINGNTVSLQFHQMAGVLALNIYSTAKVEGETIKSVKVTPAGANTKFCGAMYSTDLTADNVIYAQGGSSSYTSVTVTLDEAYDYAAEKPSDKKMFAGQIYVVLAKQSYATVIFEIETNKGVYEITSNSTPFDLALNDIYPVNINLAKATFKAAEEIEELTVAQFLDKEVSDTYYRLTGTVTELVNTEYGNFTLVDETGFIYVYGLTSEKKPSNDKSFSTLGVEEGDILTLEGKRAVHSGTPQVGGPAYYISHVKLPKLTVTPTSLSFTANGGSETVSATTANFNGEVTISAQSNNDQFTTSIEGTTITVTAAENTDNEIKTGTITITATDGAATKTAEVEVSQNKPVLPIQDGDILWQEDFTGYGTTMPSSASGTHVYGDATVTYSLGGTSTKLYNETYASGTAPELLISKNNGTFTISGIPTGGVSSMTLTYKANNDYCEIKPSNDISLRSDVSFKDNLKTVVLLVPAGVTSFDLEFKNTNSSNCRVDNFMLVAGASKMKEEQIISFGDNKSIEWTIGTDCTLNVAKQGPTVSGAETSVSYESSDNTIAEVDNSGNVTPKKAGTVTITATAEENEDYYSASDSYELTLTDPNSTDYTVEFLKENMSKGVSGYTGTSFSITDNDITLDVTNFNNNNKAWDFIKVGGKNGAYTGTITTNTAFTKAIQSVTLSIDAITVDNVTSIKLYSGDNTNSFSEVGSFEKAVGDQTVVISGPAAKKYYKIEVVCTKGTSNGLCTLSKVVYSAN